MQIKKKSFLSVCDSCESHSCLHFIVQLLKLFRNNRCGFTVESIFGLLLDEIASGLIGRVLGLANVMSTKAVIKVCVCLAIKRTQEKQLDVFSGLNAVLLEVLFDELAPRPGGPLVGRHGATHDVADARNLGAVGPGAVTDGFVLRGRRCR